MCEVWVFVIAFSGSLNMASNINRSSALGQWLILKSTVKSCAVKFLDMSVIHKLDMLDKLVESVLSNGCEVLGYGWTANLVNSC